MVAMSTGEFMSPYLHRIILLAPCFGTYSGDFDVTTLDPTKQPAFIYQNLRNVGVYKAGGDGWDNEAAAICADYDAELCEWTEGFSSDELATTIKLGEHWN